MRGDSRSDESPGSGVDQNASSSGAVIQAGRDAVVTVEHHVHHRGPPVPWALAARRLLRRDRRKSGHVFLIMSTFTQKYWVLDFLQRLHHSLDRTGLDLVLKVPDRDHDAAALSHDLRRVLTTRNGYVGGFVWPTELGRLRPHLVEFCAELALPVAFTDMEPFELESDYPENTAFVGYRSADLGAQAGHWLVEHLRRRDRRPNVLILAGREHLDRQNRCAHVLRARLGDVSIVIDDTCDFRRSRAHDAVAAHLRSAAPLDAVFCTSDDMALGAVEALRVSQHHSDTVVVGIDGIPEARVLIEAGGHLRATVVQDPHRLAESAVDVLQRMLEGRRTAKRTILAAEVCQAR